MAGLLLPLIGYIKNGRDLAILSCVCKDYRLAVVNSPVWKQLCAEKWPATVTSGLFQEHRDYQRLYSLRSSISQKAHSSESGSVPSSVSVPYDTSDIKKYEFLIDITASDQNLYSEVICGDNMQLDQQSCRAVSLSFAALSSQTDTFKGLKVGSFPRHVRPSASLCEGIVGYALEETVQLDCCVFRKSDRKMARLIAASKFQFLSLATNGADSAMSIQWELLSSFPTTLQQNHGTKGPQGVNWHRKRCRTMAVPGHHFSTWKLGLEIGVRIKMDGFRKKPAVIPLHIEKASFFFTSDDLDECTPSGEGEYHLAKALDKYLQWK